MGPHFLTTSTNLSCAAMTMLTLTIKLIIGSFLDLRQRLESLLLSAAAQRRSARKLDALGDRLLRLHGKIERMREHVQQERVNKPYDHDRSLRAMLAGFKEDVGFIRCQLVQMQAGGSTPRLDRAFDRLGQIASRAYAAADKLQWEIDDHDSQVLL